MRKLPRTNFDETLALIYEQKISKTNLTWAVEELFGELDGVGYISLDEFLELGREILNISGMTLDKYDILNLVNDKLKVDLDIDNDLERVEYTRRVSDDEDYY
jgi:hypothetical protein